MNHPSFELSELPFALVTGGKGGVGKTTLVANLGVDLARRGARVLLVDLDLALANLHVMFGVVPRVTLEDHLAGACAVEDCLTELQPASIEPGSGRLAMLPAGSGTAALARPDAGREPVLCEALRALAPSFDLVLGDSPAGIGPEVLAFGRLADQVLVVTTPEPAALTDAYGLVKALDADGRERGAAGATPELVLNLVHGAEQASRIAGRLRGVCERFLSRSPRMAAWMPRSAAVLRSSHSQEPFARGPRDGLEHRCLGVLSRRLEGVLALRPARAAG